MQKLCFVVLFPHLLPLYESKGKESGRYLHKGRPKTITQTIICIMSSGVNSESFSEQSKPKQSKKLTDDVKEKRFAIC